MRQLKFRIWHKPYQRMIYNENNSDNILLSLDGLVTKRGAENKYYNRDGYIIMLSSGLKDKNAKEIYEGDIILDPYHADRPAREWHLEWDEEKAAFKFVEIKEKYWFYTDDICLNSSEIIGNIYENPELLSKE